MGGIAGLAFFDPDMILYPIWVSPDDALQPARVQRTRIGHIEDGREEYGSTLIWSVLPFVVLPSDSLSDQPNPICGPTSGCQ